MTDDTRKDDKTHVVMYSGGIGSWMTARRVADQHGTDDLVLLFADTLVEDDDTYRFLRESAEQVGGTLVEVADGRTPFEVFHDQKFIGKPGFAYCSIRLKTDPCRKWMMDNCDPDRSALYVGIDWTETHRIAAIVKNWKPFEIFAPLADPPYYAKSQMIDEAKRVGLEPPKAYEDGFPHANCLNQGCVRGGQAYWQHLLRRKPDVYAATEAEERRFADMIEEERGYRPSILKMQVNGERQQVSLRDFREGVERQLGLFDDQEWGGCGCFVAEADQP